MVPTFSDPFAIKKIEELLALANQQPSMEQLTNSQPEQQQQEESSGGTRTVNEYMRQALPKPPNPYELGNYRNIYSAKSAWNDANSLYQNPTAYAKAEGLTDEAVQALAAQQMQNAHDAAEQSRYRLNSAGLSTNGYSAFDDTFEGVQNNLASREAQDIMGALQGAYSMTPDQYYEKEFENGIIDGLSARRAKRLAGARAREYQANRVAYLNGVFNGYGIGDDGTTNNIGTQILGMIAQDNPMLANFYAQVYPNQRDAYNTNQQIAMEALKHSNLQDIIGLNFANTLKQMGVADMYNANQQYRGGEIYRQNAEYQSMLNLKENVFRDNMKAQAEMDKILAQDEAKQREFFQKAQYGHQMAVALGFREGTPEYQAVVYKAAFGSDLPDLNKNAFNDKANNALKTFVETTGKQIENIREQLLNNELSDDERRELEKKLDEYMTAQDQAINQMGVLLGVPVEEPPFPPFSNNPAKDLPLIRIIIGDNVKQGTEREQRLKDVVDWIHQTNSEISEEFIEKYLVDNGLLPPKTKSGTPQSYEKTNKERVERAKEMEQKTHSANYLYNPNWRSR